MSKPAKVIIAGAGIAGPVLATFLKLKGYDPIVYEKVPTNAVTGLSMALQANGLRVLSLIPGLVDKIPGKRMSASIQYSTCPDDPGLLGETDVPETYIYKKYGFGIVGVERAAIHKVLIATAEEHGVPIIWGHELVSLEQGEDEVRVTFANGHTDTASFVVGCDGLHSNTRKSLFGVETADFTGLVQTGGFSRTPEILSKVPSMVNYFGNDAHIITYPVSETHSSWAISQREPESPETWHAMDAHKLDDIRNGPFSQWDFGAGELIKTAEKIIKYGLYDRPELTTWYKGRVVLLGDAAHPTSPHLGQGGNQAFEDIYHLIRSLHKHHPDAAAAFPTTTLSTIFHEYESVRLPRSAELVKGARAMGNTRVVHGVEECKARNDSIRSVWGNREAVIKDFEHILDGLKGVSEN